MEIPSKVTKGIFGGYTIKYACPKCECSLKSPLDDAGIYDVCPQCGHRFVVPGVREAERIRKEDAEKKQAKATAAERKASLAEMKLEELRQKQQSRRNSQGASDAGSGAKKKKGEWFSPLKECMDCGGTVSRNAKACPHCGSRTFDFGHTMIEFSNALMGCGCLIMLLPLLIFLLLPALAIFFGGR